MTAKKLRELSVLCRELAVDAAAVLKNGFKRMGKIRYKGRIDPVTEFDLKAEKMIIGRIRQQFPDHDILAEESGAVGRKSEYRWVIDPLDGTVNFAHGFPQYCSSVAVEFKGEIVAGAVCDPERDELFWSARGSRAYLNKQVIKVSSETKLERSLLSTGFAYDIATARRNGLGLFARMAKQAQGVRRPGSAALDLCWLTGREESTVFGS